MRSIPSRGVAIFEKTALRNGVRVVTAPFPQVGSVSCFVMLSAGSRYETPESQGIAHFAEHMFFKGTERRPTARDIATEIDSIGGEFNAFTGKELTGYYVRCGSETRAVQRRRVTARGSRACANGSVPPGNGWLFPSTASSACA